MIVLREIAHAKINLYLHVTGKRVDGFHLLDSWVVFSEYGDVLEAAKADTLSLAVEGTFAAAVPEKENSLLAAAHALAAHFHVTKGAAITLRKHLPVAAGIGGGTADGAATLRLLARLWNISAHAGELHALAAKLGSDVPACLRSRSLYMNGAGEQIAPAPEISDWFAVLANPGKPLHTADVFARLTGEYSSTMRHPAEFGTQSAAIQFLQQTKNDLQAPALQLEPVIDDVLAALGAQKGCLISRMSGSGATCYGIYNSKENAHNAARELVRMYPDWWIVETKLQ